MPIAFNNASTAGAVLATSILWTHTSTAVASGYMQAGTASGGASEFTGAAVTVATSSFTRIGDAQRSTRHLNIFELYNPPSGNLTASATFASASDHAVAIVQYNNVKSSGAYGQGFSATASSGGVPGFTSFPFSSTAASVCIIWTSTSDKAATANAAYVARIRASNGDGATHLNAFEITATGSTTTFSFSTEAQAAGDLVQLFATALTGTAAAAAFRFFTLATMGVGR